MIKILTAITLPGLNIPPKEDIPKHTANNINKTAQNIPIITESKTIKPR